MSELKFQTQLVDDIKRFNRKSFAFKLNNRFVSGLPDLFIKVPNYHPLFVETKVAVLGRDGLVKIGTTPVQRAILRRMEEAGLRVAVWTLVTYGKDKFIVRSRWNQTTTNTDTHIERVNGHWPMHHMLANPCGDFTSHIDAPTGL